MQIRTKCILFYTLLIGIATTSPLFADENTSAMNCEPVHEQVNNSLDSDRFGRTVCADIVSMDQMLVYNRFGSFNPFGMIYSLKRDVVPVSIPVQAIDADDCDADLGISYHENNLQAGSVRLRDCKRPRPLTLRANVGDILHVRLTNLLRDTGPGLSDDFCPQPASDSGGHFGHLFHHLREWVSEGDTAQAGHKEVMCEKPAPGRSGQPDGNWPQSRGANMAIQGLTAFDLEHGSIVEAHDACKGLDVIGPDEQVNCYYMIEREGPFFMASTGAPSGGQGDGGSLTHGLFGAVNVQRQNSRWYRSQTSRSTFDAVWQRQSADDHARVAAEIVDDNRYDTTLVDPVSNMEMPLLNMLREVSEGAYELVHTDLNAIIRLREGDATGLEAFRELSVFFHDELKTFYPRNFEELGDFAGGQLAGVRDGFAVNYGASGMGDMLLANRKGIGPSANCQECLYEEFFLTSWANGDPALLEQYSEDPSNVHHSYLNDAVVFRNYHAGPKETHVFHLHAHQWFAGNDKGRGSYLDSQTVAPQQGFSYDIYGGGLEVYHQGQENQPGWYETLGSGNRNRTAGDSIFHCHLYPHFAQGMWELWRVHDVLEDGSRKLPDGQWEAALSLAEMSPEIRSKKRPGSVHQRSGRRIVPATGLTGKNIGTPIPAVVPLPGQAWPLLPTYMPIDAELTDDALVDAEPISEITAFPGYPFYIAGDPGHRPPQAPMDIARELDINENVTTEFLDGGLPRHIVTDNAVRELPFKLPDDVATRLAVELPSATTLADALTDADPNQRNREALQSQIVATALALGDMSMKFTSAELKLLEYDGEPIERAAMAFHNNGRLPGSPSSPLSLEKADGTPSGFVPATGSYNSLGAAVPAEDVLFPVNAAPPKPGAPFADPCGAPTDLGTLERVSSGSYNYKTETGHSYPVFWVDAGDALTGSNAAGDTEVSNWVSHWRTDVFENGAPVLFYNDPFNGNTAISRSNLISEPDPFLAGPAAMNFTPDPAVVGYRRYKASAVQVDMITNRAGWHDPQARINVLTEKSDGYKLNPADPDSNQGLISPKVTADEEPFFFRALSGECIEFRHTNELPKELELDDFQVKTPTDTIGQHIHLVKFDVTASDGSGNGFNYEDGTFAPDEIATRICAAKNVTTMQTNIADNRAPGDKLIREGAGLCEQVQIEVDGQTSTVWRVKNKDIWKQRRTDNRELFQTTTQRWFADPILSDTRAANDQGGIGKADRTLRTVFSHDHFGPSSIQQHGFYTALVIEPQSAQICSQNGSLQNGSSQNDECTPVRTNRDLEVSDSQHVGARKVIVDLMPTDTETTSYREFALSIADFAVLYDPRDSYAVDDLDKTISGANAATHAVPVKGMATLYCEALHAMADNPSAMADKCGSELQENGGFWSGAPGDVPPAWLANKRPGDDPAHSDGMADNLLARIEVPSNGTNLPADLFLHHYLTEYRLRAAGFTDTSGRMASPVAPPVRPESISVSHHDPYLINYKGEPLPLRLGSDSSLGSDCALKPLVDWETSLLAGVAERCTISEQKTGDPGDPANVFLSNFHGDPATPILRTNDNDPVQLRLIQGAQEVQHTFTIEGYNFPRHVDQSFPMDMVEPDNIAPLETLARNCEEHTDAGNMMRVASAGRPDEYHRWARQGLSAFFAGTDSYNFWSNMQNQLANCFNAEGRITAQEIGISEHFEFRAGFLHDNNFIGLGQNVNQPPGNTRFPTVKVLQDTLEKANEFNSLARQAMDTPYHFGSQDALWNGAWGLVRVAPDNQQFQLTEKIQPLIDAELSKLKNLIESGKDSAPPADLLTKLTPLIDTPLDYAGKINPELTGKATLTEVSQTVQGNPGDSNRLTPLEKFENMALSANLATPKETSADLLKRFNLSPEIQHLDSVKQEARIKAGLIERQQLGGESKPSRYKQVAECPSGAPQVYTSIVAIETRTAFKSKATSLQVTNYSNEIFDHDGLFFALLDPRRILDPADPAAITDEMIRDPNSWASISRQHLIDEINLVYDRPEPLVINVNAGDCVFVTLLNALGRKNGVINGLPDAPGDAEMPRITSLNVERLWNEDTDTAGYITADTTSDRRSDIEPSARLAISLPLPILTRQSSYARPYGDNPIWALDGVDGDLQSDRTLSIEDHNNRIDKTRKAQIEQFEFYAGLAFADDKHKFAPGPFLTSHSISDNFIGNLGNTAYIKLPEVVSKLSLNEDGNTIGELIMDLQKAKIGIDKVSEKIYMEKEDRASSQELHEDALETKIELIRREISERDEELNEALDKAKTEYENKLAPLEFLGRPSMRKKLSTNFIPYAFGALPIKSFGDVIGHPTHGLIGAVTVVPRNATIYNTRAPRLPLQESACLNPRLIPDNVTDENVSLRLSDLPPDIAVFAKHHGKIRKSCESFVIRPTKSSVPMWATELTSKGPSGEGDHRIRQFTLFWQDGLNQRDRNTGDSHTVLPGGANQHTVADCLICDDSYDFGDKGASFHSEPFNVRLRNRSGTPADLPVKADLNKHQFGNHFYRVEPGEIPTDTQSPFPVLRAIAGEEVVVHIVHPGGRARQRSFATIGQDYNDLFPGFGFPRSALLAPGKAITASFSKRLEPGCYLWFDGPLHLRAGGVWGLLDVVNTSDALNPEASNCLASESR